MIGWFIDKGKVKKFVKNYLQKYLIPIYSYNIYKWSKTIEGYYKVDIEFRRLNTINTKDTLSYYNTELIFSPTGELFKNVFYRDYRESDLNKILKSTDEFKEAIEKALK